jgi:membrane-bound ClpP family serine protease
MVRAVRTGRLWVAALLIVLGVYLLMEGLASGRLLVGIIGGPVVVLGISWAVRVFKACQL